MINHVELICVLILGGCYWTSLLLPDNIRFYPRINILVILLTVGVLIGVSVLSLHENTFFARYILLLCYFHFSEGFLVSFSSKKCQFDSFLINHGIHYASAFILSSLEHFFSPYHFPESAQLVGLIMCIVGLCIRATSLMTAGQAFTHLIAHRKSDGHRLVTHGIYSWMRHPGYCGWLIWVTSSQVLAGNIVSMAVFFCASLYFFQERIEFEESLLVRFFGNEYDRYKKDVPFSGIPFINS